MLSQREGLKLFLALSPRIDVTKSVLHFYDELNMKKKPVFLWYTLQRIKWRSATQYSSMTTIFWHVISFTYTFLRVCMRSYKLISPRERTSLPLSLTFETMTCIWIPVTGTKMIYHRPRHDIRLFTHSISKPKRNHIKIFSVNNFLIGFQWRTTWIRKICQKFKQNIRCKPRGF